MIAPKSFGAGELTSLPLQLKHVRDLEEFEGPLLSEFVALNGETFVYYWCDSDKEFNRWLVVRTTKPRLMRYLVRKADLRDLIAGCPDQAVYIVDVDANGEAKAFWFAPVPSLPAVYAPKPGVLFSALPGADAGDDAGLKHFQDVALAEDAGFETVANYPRKYLQAYSFHAHFGPGGHARNISISYNLTKGFVFGTLFRQLQANVPRAKIAKTEEISYASPGYLRFSVEPNIAKGVRDSVMKYAANEFQVRELSKTLSVWSNKSGKQSKAKVLKDSDAREHILRIGRLLGVDGGGLVRHCDSLWIAAKAMISYARRIRFLAEDEAWGTASMVGLPPTEDGFSALRTGVRTAPALEADDEEDPPSN
ncbi:MAG: hypothetical protein QM723_40665 [Myxococcaceae bacterium]